MTTTTPTTTTNQDLKEYLTNKDILYDLDAQIKSMIKSAIKDLQEEGDGNDHTQESQIKIITWAYKIYRLIGEHPHFHQLFDYFSKSGDIWTKLCQDNNNHHHKKQELRKCRLLVEHIKHEILSEVTFIYSSGLESETCLSRKMVIMALSSLL